MRSPPAAAHPPTAHPPIDGHPPTVGAQVDSLVEVIIPRITPDGSAAQFRVGAVPGHTMLSMFKVPRGRTAHHAACIL